MLPEGWESTTLGKIMDFRNGLNFSKADSKNLIKVVGVSDFSRGNVLSRTDSLKETYVDQFKDDDLLKGSDFLFVRSNGNKSLIGRCLYFPHIPEPISFSGFTIRGRLKNRSINAHYIFQIVAGEYFRKHINLSGSGTNISNLSQEILSNTPIALPPLPEQKKIAAILSTWDRAIEGTETLLTNSQQQKKALMQQLLTGKKRLPGFTGEWKTKTFSDLFTLKIGGTPARSNMAYWDTDKTTPNRWVAISDLKTSKIHSTSEHISYLGAKNSNCSLIPKGTIILSFKLTIGKKAILLEDCYTNEAICALIIKNTKSTDVLYIYQALDKVNYEEEIDQAVKGKTLNKEKLARLRVPFPALPEQKAIAAVLTTADEEITTLESDLSRLRQEKKALMQQLLTGKRRVTVD